MRVYVIFMYIIYMHIYAVLWVILLCFKKCHLMQNTQYCATGTTRGGTELTVCRSSTTLANSTTSMLSPSVKRLKH